MMSRKAASWSAAALTLFATLLVGAVLLRPMLVESSHSSNDQPTTNITVVDDSVPDVNGYEYEDDDEQFEDGHEFDDDDRYEHEESEHDDD